MGDGDDGGDLIAHKAPLEVKSRPEDPIGSNHGGGLEYGVLNHFVPEMMGVNDDTMISSYNWMK
jgi:hypothetical protein